MRAAFLLPLVLLSAACGGVSQVGRAPDLSPLPQSPEIQAMASPGLPESADGGYPIDGASLWTGARGSLLGNRRAENRGDILTVVIAIDDRAEMENTTDRSRVAAEAMGIPSFFGIPQRIDENLPEGASLGAAVAATSASSYDGQGGTSRNEELTLRVAATVTDVLPNGSLVIEGRQEVRVNYELRELFVTGAVRPGDITRQNEVNYDKIASARISYGGRGNIQDVQRPRYGQRVADKILPF